MTIRRKMTKRISVALVAILALVGLYASGTLRAGAGSVARAPEPASHLLFVPVVQAVQQESHERLRSFRGRLEARRETRLAFELRGRLAKVMVLQGARVEQGQVLARLDRSSEEARCEQVQAELGAARARLDELVAGPRREEIARAAAQVSELEHSLSDLVVKERRMQSLVAEKVSSKALEEEIVFARKAMAARLDAARALHAELSSGTRKELLQAQRAVVTGLGAAVRQSRVLLGKHDLVAPFAGRISKRYLHEGRIVDPGTPVLHLVEDQNLEGRVGMPARQAGLLEPGDKLEGLVGQRAASFRVQSVLPVIDATTHTQDVILVPEPTKGKSLPIGEVLLVQVREQVEERGFWLPTEALLRGERGLWAAYIARLQAPADDGRVQVCTVERRLVEVLHVEERRVYVRGTLQDGELVVASGVHRLAVGQRVRISIRDESVTSRSER